MHSLEVLPGFAQGPRWRLGSPSRVWRSPRPSVCATLLSYARFTSPPTLGFHFQDCMSASAPSIGHVSRTTNVSLWFNLCVCVEVLVQSHFSTPPDCGWWRSLLYLALPRSRLDPSYCLIAPSSVPQLSCGLPSAWSHTGRSEYTAHSCNLRGGYFCARSSARCGRTRNYKRRYCGHEAKAVIAST